MPKLRGTCFGGISVDYPDDYRGLTERCAGPVAGRIDEHQTMGVAEARGLAGHKSPVINRLGHIRTAGPVPALT